MITSRTASRMLALVALIFVTGCGPFQKNSAITDANSKTSNPSIEPTTPDDPSQPSQPATPTTPISTLAVAPLWEKVRGEEAQSWTNFAAALILAEGTNMLKGTADMPNFCPNYENLTTSGKVNVWVYLVSAVVKYESAFNPLSRMKEALGTDSVTHQPVYSEGLLQLSYQDAKGWSFCNEFNWNADKLLSVKDPKKTILDPYKNLRCGIRIMNRLVGKHNAIAYDSGNYWSTLKPKNASEHAIQALVNNMSICKR